MERYYELLEELLKWPCYPKQCTNLMPIKISMKFFTEPKWITLKFIRNHKDSELPKQSWEKKNKNCKYIPPRFQTILQGYSNQSSIVLAQKKRHIDQWNRIEGPEINPLTYTELICNKKGKNIQWRKDSLFNKWCWESLWLH